MPVVRQSGIHAVSRVLWSDGATELHWDFVAKAFMVKRNDLQVTGNAEYLVARILEISQTELEAKEQI